MRQRWEPHTITAVASIIIAAATVYIVGRHAGWWG